MEKKTFGEMIKTNREILNLTTYDLGARVDISNAYVSKIENNSRTPSLLVFFKLLNNIRLESLDSTSSINEEYEIIKGGFSTVEILKEYSSIKDIDYYDLKKEYDAHLSEFLSSHEKQIDKIKKHEVRTKKSTMTSVELELPYMDLEWLLTQKEYYVYYGKQYDFYRLKDCDEPSHYSSLHAHMIPEHDIRTIKRIIDEFFKNKYELYDSDHFKNNY